MGLKMNYFFSESEIFEIAMAKKERKKRFRLKETCEIEHEFDVKPFGPSSFAFVKFLCSSSESLTFESKTQWCCEEYIPNKSACEAMLEGIFDVLVSSPYIHCCSVSLIASKGNAVRTSYNAFYLATVSAMNKLVSRKEVWVFGV